ncbi:MAG TPA: GH3 auxin-responsive promoter family protein [Cytophagaceae bacterium]
MTLLGALLNKGLKITRQIGEQDTVSPFELQKKELKKLLKKASNTKFGRAFNFDEIIPRFKDGDVENFYNYYKKRVPVSNYNKIFNEWWHRSKEGEADVCWPGVIKYFALSSGTSEASTKHIPLSKDIMKANKRTSIRQILTLSNYDLPPSLLEKGILMLGGSTDLQKYRTYYEGDLSGIQASKIPLWFNLFYKPGKKIAKNRDWNKKLEEITLNAKNWDIGFIVGVPAWIQILMEKIVEHYKVKTIHDIWPNLMVFVHGGVSFDPYKKGFEKLMGRPITYIETYLASEGFVAFQVKPNRHSMKLVLNNGLFLEFIPFTEDNFDSEGEVVANPKTLMIHQVEEGVDYALLLTTCSGAWRYLIGDVIRFVSKAESEIIISGRTKHFLSLCGEHLSVENMNKAIQLVSEELNISIKEFTVAGVPYDTLFAHKWFIGTDDAVDSVTLKEKLDEKLKVLNDDYKVERSAALKEVIVNILPTSAFYKWMTLKGKEGGQNKFPRVMKKTLFEGWEEYLKKENYLK